MSLTDVLAMVVFIGVVAGVLYFLKSKKKDKAVVIPDPVVRPMEAAPVQPVVLPHIVAPSTRAYIGNQGDKPVEAVDRSGNDLSDGGVRIFVLANGQKQTVTFNRGGKVRIFGSSGTQLKALSDWETRKATGTIAVFERTFAEAGSYTFSVESVGGNIAAQFR